jgi:hypothetical protein
LKRFFRAQVGFLLWGLAFWFPIAIVFFVLSFLLGNVEDIGRRIFLILFPARFFYQGLGVALGLVIIYVSGVILKGTKIRTYLSKVPILGLFFGGGDVITVDRLTNLTPCLFMYSPTMLSYGWILSEERVDVGDHEAPFTLLNVYYPNVPTLVTGQVFPVRKETVIKLGNPSKEVIDLLLYAFRSPNALKYLPWEGESHAEFEARASRFGIQVTYD